MNFSQYMNPPATHCEIILSHLHERESITSLEAMEEYGICRLSARIKELRDRGYVIETKKQKGKNRYGKKISYGVYTLAHNC